ncbi:lethal(2) giant larvae protein homolog 2-like [Protobothrops mucrosquamatus]|uniref:lethal(2) giant larvae protein homolog 2-like n=1 Tax=Protobothrops mucrosquamatus TaxID=103944 RepID=UPI000775C5BD|nr:lethal(2) giant larvae protein homolog 2-like [Protobothrops mucrosquamatus]
MNALENRENCHGHSTSGTEKTSKKSNNIREPRQTSGEPVGDERMTGRLMEHALLNDENVLKEIQSTLEGGRGSYYNRSSGRIQVGHTLSNGGGKLTLYFYLQ